MNPIEASRCYMAKVSRVELRAAVRDSHSPQSHHRQMVQLF